MDDGRGDHKPFRGGSERHAAVLTKEHIKLLDTDADKCESRTWWQNQDGVNEFLRVLNSSQHISDSFWKPKTISGQNKVPRSRLHTRTHVLDERP
jgi:hypothetical protein